MLALSHYVSAHWDLDSNADSGFVLSGWQVSFFSLSRCTREEVEARRKRIGISCGSGNVCVIS